MYAQLCNVGALARMGMIVMHRFYLPFSAVPSSDWLLYEDGKATHFRSRREALVCAIDRCRAVQASVDDEAIISIEGDDGLWRSFDSRLLPVASPVIDGRPYLH